MASWTLGKIFSVDEEKEATQDPSESGSDSEDDDDVRDRQAAFNKSKLHSSTQVEKENATSSNRSIRRYDEFGDFLSRSERAHAELMREQEGHTEPAAKGADGLKVSGAGKNHRVWFGDGGKLEVIYEVPRMTNDEKERCFMQTENWVSIDSDIDLTTKRWGYHMEGKLAFDEDNNTIRGIEDMIFRLNKFKPIMKHRKAILEEVVRQKTANEYPNWAKLSAISETSSAVQRKMAIELAKEDEQEKNRIWTPKKSRASQDDSAQ